MKRSLILKYFLSIIISSLLFIRCGNLAEEAATALIQHGQKNLCPKANGDNYTIENGGILNIDFNHGVLSNDADPGGGAMAATVVVQTKKGTLTLNIDGSFTYSHDGSGPGEDDFIYAASTASCDNTTEPDMNSMAKVTITITSQPSVPSGTIYVAGYYNANANDYGCYWTDKNGDGVWERTDLPDARIIHDIAVHNGKVYAVGETTWAKGEQDPAIWIDGVKTELDAPNVDEDWGGATAYALAFDGDNIYVAGNYPSEKAALGGVSSACYWKINANNPKGIHVPLQKGVSSDAYGIAIHNGQPISVGWYMKGHNIHPAKWIGTKRYNLDNKNDGEAQDIVVDGNDYYISGWTDNARKALHYYPTVWKNNQSTRKRLTEGSICTMPSKDREVEVPSIARKNGKTYAAGWTYFDFSVTHHSYWTDIEFTSNQNIGTIHELTTDVNGNDQKCGSGGEMNDIAVLDNGETVIVGNSSWNGFAVIWYNGVMHYIEKDKMSEANSVFIE